MKKEFSKKWVSSTQPRKQHKYRANAPLHLRQKMMGCHLDEKLMKEFKTRSLPVRKGDKVMVMRGKFRKLTGEVTEVDLKNLRVYIDTAKRKKSSGQDVPVALQPSNLKLMEIKKDDKKRQKIIERKKK
jgi:large subunit ribosomal protein L24